MEKKEYTQDEAKRLSEEKDMDIVYDDENGNLKVYPCPSTQAVLQAIKELNEEKIKSALDISPLAQEKEVLMKPLNDFSMSICIMIKEGVGVDKIASAFVLNKIDMQTWVADEANKYSILHIAARYNRADVIKYALLQGCSVCSQSYTGDVPMHYAVNYGASREVLDLLYKAPFGEKSLDIRGRNGRTPMTEEQRKKFYDNPNWTSEKFELPGELRKIFTDWLSKDVEIEKREQEIKKPSKKQKVSEEKEDNIPEFERCLICMERRANTLVLPCNCICVCTECSQKLEKTADSAVCVKCRRPIDSILSDGDVKIPNLK